MPGNAIKFTETGTVSLKVEPDQDFAVPTALRFTVTDSGIGIAEVKLSSVFERFAQADSSAYLATCRSDVTTMPKALGRADFAAVAILPHKLRGSGGAFGFQAITDFGEKLEDAAENPQPDELDTLLLVLSRYLDSAESPA